MSHRLIYHAAVALLLIGSLCAGFAQTNSSPAVQGPAEESASAEPARGQGGKQVFVLPVNGMISDVILTSLKRRVDEAQEVGVDLIVIEMDTYGGLVISALEICRYIKNLDIDTLVWVHDKAYSAGAMISVACDGIVMSARSSIGDCAPIAPGQSLGETERAKAESPILEEFRDSAQRNGYPIVLSEAMVRLGPAVYMIEKILPEQAEQAGQSDAPQRRAEEGEREVQFVWANHLPAYGLEPTYADRSEADPAANDLIDSLRDALESATEEEAEDSQQTDPAPDATPDATADTTDAAPQSPEWRIVKRVNPPDTLLTLTQTEAVEYGFAHRIIADEAALAAFTGDADGVMPRLGISWSEYLVNWLTSPAVRGVLMLLLMIGGYMELQSPGLGLGGAVALTALVIMLGAPYLAGMAGVFDIILILVGMALLGIEVFVLPGFGIAGFLGLVAMFAGFLMTFVQNEPGPGWLPTLQGTWEMLREGALTLALATLVASVAFYFLARHFGSLPVLNRLVLQTQQISQNAPAPASGEPVTATANELGLNVGDTGRAITQLRPTGRVEIEGEVVDVVTHGGWVEHGRRVRIVEVHGNRIVVEEA